MAKALSTNVTTIYVAGQAYVVATEVARAMSRHTPIGSTAVADSHVTLDAGGNNYIGGSTGSVSKATVPLGN